jgi:hypothetical protein
LHPHYLRQILQTPCRKVYVLFFEWGMLVSEDRLRHYVQNIEETLRRNFNHKKDRVVFLWNKCDEMPDLFRAGRPVCHEFEELFYSKSATWPLIELLRVINGGRMTLLPYSSGQFDVDTRGRRTFYMSAEHYPAELWKILRRGLEPGFFSWLWS